MAPRRVTKIVTGLHIVKKTLVSGVRYYVYAWRGGPCIHTTEGQYPKITPSILAKQQRAITAHYTSGENVMRIDDLVRQFEERPEYGNLAKGTRLEYGRHLSRISLHFGKTPVEAFEDTRMRGKIIAWKNQWQEQPRTADMAAGMMSQLLAYAVDQGLLKVNVAAKIKTLHKVNRSHLIWEQKHWDAFYALNPPQHIKDVVELGALTGLRQEDILKLTWGMVGPTAIIFPMTTKRKTRAVIPIYAELAQWLKQRADRQDTVTGISTKGHIVVNSRGFPWTKDGFKSSYRTKVPPKEINRHFHDLRGTFVTKLILSGLTDQEVAFIVGWENKQVEQIRARYVNEERVILDIAARLKR